MKDFADHAQQITESLKKAALRLFQQAQRPMEYLPSAKTRKEELARQIAVRDGIHTGPLCLLTSLEVCPSSVHFNHITQQLRLTARSRKHLHLYRVSKLLLRREARVRKRSLSASTPLKSQARPDKAVDHYDIIARQSRQPNKV